MKGDNFMTSRRLWLYIPLICASVLCSSVLSVEQALADETITSDIKIAPKKKLTDNEFRALSEAAGRILTHVHLARRDIRKKDLDAAKGHVEKSLTLVKIIENSAPTYEVVAKIKSGDITYEDKRVVEQLVVPIFAELDQTEYVLQPIKQAKKESAAQATAKNSSVPVDMDFVFTKASLDVGETKLDLLKAAQALEAKDAEAANQSLADIQNRLVIFEYDEWDAPVVRARSYVWEALKSIENKEWSGAKNYVTEASEAIKSLTERGGKEVSEKVKVLSEQMSALTKKIDEKKDSAKTDIISIWDKLTKGM
jgi:cellobiose-specific phosphotransferase system component IIA